MAGHVDHGKTALIRALTGVETDRLPEEQRRGMTIDLGFAYLHAADGVSIGFVDVPGHERFLPNMLAGVLGVERALLVVAADDGPMPQTLEHLGILALSGAREVAAVVTKIDMVGPERVAEVAGQARALLVDHGFSDAPVRAVSAHAGTGLADLRAALLAWAAGARAEAAGGGFRMAIDRRFSLRGIGLVVTGTVLDGAVSAGENLTLSPARLAARVRSIRVQDRAAERAVAGDRCALALTGARIDAERVRRGQWLLAPTLHAPGGVLDVALRAAGGQVLRHGRLAHLHWGTGTVAARVRLLEGRDLQEGEGFARLNLAEAVPALHGDRVVLRDDGSGRILAGGRVIDPFPPRRREKRENWRARLAALALADPGAALAGVLAADGSVDLARFALARNRDRAGLVPGAGVRLVGRGGQVAVAPEVAAALRARLLAVLAEWHATHPDYPGPAKAALLARVEHGSVAAIAEAVLQELVDERAVVLADGVYRLPEHSPRLAPADEALGKRVAAILDAAGLRPPRVRELMAELGLELDQTAALLERLARFGRLRRVAANRYFLPETIAALAGMAAELAAAHDGFTAAEFNKRSGIGRNLTIQVLEYLDSQEATERTGEVRHVGSGQLF